MSKSRGPAPSGGILLAAFGIIGELALIAMYVSVGLLVAFCALVLSVLFGNNKRGK